MKLSELPTPGKSIQFKADADLAAGFRGRVLELRNTGDNDMVGIGAGGTWHVVEPADAPSRRTLRSLIGGEVGTSSAIGWLAAEAPDTEGSGLLLMIQAHRFSAELQLSEPLELAVDDKLVDELRRSRRLSARAGTQEALHWLQDRFLVSIGDGSSLTLGTFGDRGSLALHGRDCSADTAKQNSGSVLVTRVRPLDRRIPSELSRPTLVRGQIRFVDSTQAGALRLTTTAALDAIAARADSYLRLWQDYNEIERRQLLARARSAGWVHYSECKAVPSGGWRFWLTRDTDDVIEALSNADQDIAASEGVPMELVKPEALVSNDEVRREPFSGRIRRTGEDARTVDLLPEEDAWESRQPPPKGVLHLSLGGDRVRLQRRERARQRIQGGDAPMVQLGLLLEGKDVHVLRGKRYSRVPRQILGQFGETGPTARQEEALLIAMNTPDVAVIQGPPGTGKTKVITALQSWLADEGDAHRGLGGSVLLTSFQHDAVDNAAERTNVLDLPAVRIGGRRGIDGLRVAARRWADELRIQLEADLAEQGDAELALRADEIARLARAYALQPRDVEATASLLEAVSARGTSLITGSTRDALLARAAHLRARRTAASTTERRALLLAARALRTTSCSFADDGRETALRLRFQLRSAARLKSADDSVLQQASITEEPSADLLTQLLALQERLIDALSDRSGVLTPVPRHDRPAREILSRAAAEALAAAEASRGGVGGIVASYLDDVEHDPIAVEDTLRRYAAVLAATCQQSASHAMAALKADEEFDTVIVDEAARANPLDLMIPMSRAQRRIVLVGDHRQLPHVLEPDVQRELEGSVAEETRAAFAESLFERLYEDFEQRARPGNGRDEPRRVVTLNTQFRMHPRLGEFVSDAFYEQDGVRLAAGRDALEFVHGLDRYADLVAAWEDVPLLKGNETRRMSKSRPAEARLLAELLPELMHEQPTLSFGVISFYREQVKAIQRELAATDVVRPLDDGEFEIMPLYREGRDDDGRRIDRLRIGTVDAFQGMEFDIVLLSLTRSSPDPGVVSEKLLRNRYGHLMLANRLCVAMSRQRRLLIVVGDRQMVESPSGAEAVPALARFVKLCTEERARVLA